jgi:hypothetical protein
MIISGNYVAIYVITFIFSIIKAIFCFLTMVGFFHVLERVWLVILSTEVIILIGCALAYDSSIPRKSPNHNVYKIYIVSILAIVMTVLFFMIFAAFGLIVPEIAIMTYLYFCLPIWLHFLISFFVLQEKQK